MGSHSIQAARLLSFLLFGCFYCSVVLSELLSCECNVVFQPPLVPVFRLFEMQLHVPYRYRFETNILALAIFQVLIGQALGIFEY